MDIKKFRDDALNSELNIINKLIESYEFIRINSSKFSDLSKELEIELLKKENHFLEKKAILIKEIAKGIRLDTEKLINDFPGEYWSGMEEQIKELVETSNTGNTISEGMRKLCKRIYKDAEAKEERYFISYSAYLENKNDYDIFNNIITIDEPITMDIIQKIESDYLKMINDGLDERLYYSVQIITINKI